MRLALVAAIALLAACDDNIDPPWQLDHDRIIAVRATPPAIMPGERSELDALLTFKDGATVEQVPEAATVISPMVLAGFVAPEGGKWVVSMPPPAMLAAARMELKLSANAPVPLQIGVAYAGGTLFALKIVMLGETAANPVLAEMLIDGQPMEAMTELVVPRLVDVRLSIPAIPDDDVNWLTNVGEMHDFDLPEAYLRVEDDEDRFEGELALVKRDPFGGVAWRVWPIRVQ